MHLLKKQLIVSSTKCTNVPTFGQTMLIDVIFSFNMTSIGIVRANICPLFFGDTISCYSYVLGFPFLGVVFLVKIFVLVKRNEKTEGILASLSILKLYKLSKIDKTLKLHVYVRHFSIFGKS